MALGEMLRNVIDEMGPWQEGARAATVRGAGVEVECSLSAGDVLGVAVEELRLWVDRPVDLPVEQVADWAREICRRITYLLEPLRLLEVDAIGGVAQVRSEHARRREAGTSYYELMVRSDRTVTLRRLHARSRSREAAAVPFTLTTEQLQDLVDDLLAARPED